MMTLVLLHATAAMASPLSARDTYPPLGCSDGFKLIINVTDLSTDLSTSPVHGKELTSIHVGAGSQAPVPAPSGNGSSFFATSTGTIQEDIAATNPYGLDLPSLPEENDPTLYDLHVNIGGGQQGFSISSGPCPAMQAPREGTFVACDQGFDVYAHPQFVLKFVDGVAAVPANCTAVKLLPQCATLSGGQAATDAGPESGCYVGPVADVDWTLFTAC